MKATSLGDTIGGPRTQKRGSTLLGTLIYTKYQLYRIVLMISNSSETASL